MREAKKKTEQRKKNRELSGGRPPEGKTKKVPPGPRTRSRG